MVNRDMLAPLRGRRWKVVDVTDLVESDRAEKFWVALAEDGDVIRFDADKEAWELAAGGPPAVLDISGVDGKKVVSSSDLQKLGCYHGAVDRRFLPVEGEDLTRAW